MNASKASAAAQGRNAHFTGVSPIHEIWFTLPFGEAITIGAIAHRSSRGRHDRLRKDFAFTEGF
ncbi:MAG: hypothetical protein E7813_05080 [Bradyrhizobium sp.]|uniref:hypothetical protein n=1 Tax=Bradyrhizobium sp. TaxID=376 RepID=UPI00121AD438|nr:hypothetical protein [Bradyrhizobium sp.]THD71656.1 MAG: hypothetical protein E7813_05080 [Bradyrhizobium sp.]